jgi:hypothetical protein
VETTRTTEGPVAGDGRRIRRVYLEQGQGWPPEDRWQLCRHCGARTLRGYLRCSQCGESLRDRDERPRFQVLGEYTDRVSEGEDVGAVSDYLHQQGYLAGPQVDTALRRRRRRLWRRMRRARGKTAILR